jgi:PAS domain S-box-containing protein
VSDMGQGHHDVERLARAPSGEGPTQGATRAALLVSKAVRTAGAISIVIGTAYLAAWLGGIAARWSAAGVITVKTNMALSLSLAGASLLLLEPRNAGRGRRLAGLVAAALVLAVGVLTLSEHLFGWNLGIDQLLEKEPPGATATASPNRVGPLGAVSLIVIGAGLIATAWRWRVALYLGLATCVVVSVPAVGFLYGISPFYSQAYVTGIAWPTVIALFSLGLGLMLAHSIRDPLSAIWRDDPGGVLLRRVLLPAVLVPIMVGYVRVEGERLGLYSLHTGTGLLVIVIVLFLCILLWRSAEQLSSTAAHRQRVTDQLAAEKQRLTVTLRSIADAVIATDESSRTTVFNEAAEKLTGWKAEEAIGRPLHEVFNVVNEETRKPAVSPVERVLREGVVVGLANHTALVARDGTERPIADSGAPIRGSDGNISGVVLVFRDQTEERHAQRAQARLAAIVESTDDAIISKDLHGTILTWNAGAERLLGYGAEEIVGQSMELIIPPGRGHEESEIVSRIAAGERVAHFETKRVRKGGAILDVSITVSPLRDSEGRISGASTIMRDVSEFIATQEALRQASRLKDDFLSMASHELRTPLATLRLHTETLGRTLRKIEVADERVERKLSAMDSQFDRMESLVYTLLDVSRITAGKLVLDLATCDLGDLAREVVERFESQADTVGSELRLHAGRLAGCWDRMRIDQVITNLVSNALKYGAGKPVEVTVDERDGAAVLVVRDQGVGIAPESQDRIFDRFERAANTYPVSGLGLGLWIAKRLVEAHGGKITVKSAPAAGATFTVTLPRGTS